MSNDHQRISKIIARSGVASRREAESLVEAGRVRVNGSVVHHPGHPVAPGDIIEVNGRPIPIQATHVYILLNKPKGTITGRSDPEGRPTVLDLVAKLQVRVEPVGRLDMDTEGMLLLTNDGDLAHKLTHPSTGVPKRYVAKVWRTPDEKTLKRVRAGINLEDGRTHPCKVRIVETTDSGNAWVEVTVTEGRNRLIRRMFEAVNHPVSKLRRESFATIADRSLARGAYRVLTPEEVKRLRDIAAGIDPTEAGAGGKYKKGYARPKPKNARGTRKRMGEKRAARTGGQRKAGASPKNRR
jgi:23S rRNA pseudouridine2605 synthase